MKNYTMNGNRVFHSFDRLCTLFKLKPSRWLPTFPPPKGVYLQFVTLTKEPERKTSHHEFFDGYHFLWYLFDGWKIRPLRWIFGQLFETYTGIYDYVDWSKSHEVTDEERAEMRNTELWRPK